MSATLTGAEAVAAALAQIEGERRGADGAPTADERSLRLLPASSVPPLPTRWAWRDRIPLGAVSLLVGQEGSGKSTIACDVLARASRGALEGDLHGRPAGSVYATAEDSWARTIVPRLTAAGADLDHVHFVEIDELPGGLTIPGDLDLLDREMRRVGARLLVLDPLGAHLHGSLDTHRDSSVRRALAPLAARMDSLGGAALGIMHWSKAPTTVALDRVNGSRGFTAAARAMLAVGDDPDDAGSHFLVVAKSNLGRLDLPALRYRIEGRSIPVCDDAIESSGVVWLGEAPGVTSRDLFASPDEEERSERDEVADVVADVLAEGARAYSDVSAAVRNAGLSVSDKTIQRACRSLRVERRKEGFGPGSRYLLSLPSMVDNPPHMVDTPQSAVQHAEAVQLGADQDFYPHMVDTGPMVDTSRWLVHHGEAVQHDEPSRGRRCPKCGTSTLAVFGPESACRTCFQAAE